MSSAERGTAVLALALVVATLQALPVEGVRSLEALLAKPDAFFESAEAARVAEGVLAHQRANGGWPKNVDMTRPPAPGERGQRGATDTTIDNGATVTQLRYLARVLRARTEDRLAAAFLAGLDYLLAAQYPGGGWPQFFPLRSDYSRHITFNDGAMTNVLALLKDTGEGAFPFVDAARRRRAAEAVAKGIGTILAAQIRSNGVLTGWCAQHDEKTLEPRGARRYEHPSIAGKETVEVVRFLMTIPDPSEEVVTAIEAAVAWLRSVAVAESGGARWARFYEIGTNRPIFSGRDGVVRYDLSEVEGERRLGYSWYGPYARDLLSRDYPAWRARRVTRVVVAADGSGQFRTIQEALDAISPAGTDGPYTLVVVRNGVYREKLFITRSRLALVGEDRDRTRIEYAELRRRWRESHPDDWGAAVVNIGPEVTDLVLANLTIRNDHGMSDGDRDHQFAVRSSGNATRIALLHANVLSEGGDTLSLWNAATGLSYHADCAFEGWVDFVCPRGTAYITGSRFFSHSPTAAIWHDGSKDRNHKLVIRRSRFDGVPGFPLGRHHRDAQIYVLDATFSSSMADRPIYQAVAPDPVAFGTRTYYAGCHRDGGDFAWFRDNLEAAAGSPREEEITAAWTFGGRWDPENELPAVLPFAALPRPEDGWRHVDPRGTTLRFLGGRDALSHRIHFGTANPPPLRADQAERSYETGPLEPGTTYHWRVDTVTPSGVVPGRVWSFVSRPSRTGIRPDAKESSP